MSLCRELSYVSILNTHGEEILQWFPKNGNRTVAGLKYFIEINTCIPFNNQVLYYRNREHMDLVSIGSYLEWLFRHDENTTLEIVLTYRYISKSRLDNKAFEFIKKYSLQKLTSIRIKEAKYGKTIIDMTMENLVSCTHWEIKLTQSIMELYNITYDQYDLMLNSGKSIATCKYVENLFFLGSKFEENVELVLVFSKHSSFDKTEGFYFTLLGLKKLVLKSLTRSEVFDINEYRTLSSIGTNIQIHMKIPKHLQIFMHKKRKISKKERLSDIFWYHCNEEENAEGTLTINLISKPPASLTVRLTSPYPARIGLPETLEIKETATIAEAENYLSELIQYPITLMRHDKLSVTDICRKEQFLYEIPRRYGEQLQLLVFRSFEINFRFCSKCCEETLRDKQTFFVLYHEAKTVEKLLKEHFNRWLCCSDTKWRLSRENAKYMSKDSLLVDLAPDVIISLEATSKSFLALRRIFKK
uniref:Uncharacterized protein n=1 Tax=Clytia hemisphaerica TaxID=252671 RepID=A0A7M5WQC6_9CNID